MEDEIKDLRDALLKRTGNDVAKALEQACEICLIWIDRARKERGLSEWKQGDEVWPERESEDDSLKL